MTDVALPSKPETAEEALKRWDAGETVFTVEMGGLGPSYEQCIHVAAFELIRGLLKEGHIDWEDESDDLNSRADAILRASPRCNELGLSGAQAGQAKNLAFRTMRVGWRKAIDMEAMTDASWPQPGCHPRSARLPKAKPGSKRDTYL